MHDHDLLGRCQLGLQAVRRVRSVAKFLALLPFVDCLLGNAQALGQDGRRFRAGSNLGAHSGRGASILVQGDHHEGTLPVDCSDFINSRSTARAMNSG